MRYAVYFCPSEASALGAFGREWFATTSVPGISPERWLALMTDVRRYSWHATLCAPFELAECTSYAQLREKAEDIAPQMEPFELPLELAWLSGFLALRPTNNEMAVKALAERCVRHLNSLRAPLTEAAWDRRVERLDDVERRLFREYGYPYVLERFRFHMTLSAPATVDEEQAMRAWLAPKLIGRSTARVDALTICREQDPGKPFEYVERIPLGRGRTA